MRILRPIIEAAADLLPNCGADLTHRRGLEQSPSVTIFRGRPYLFMIHVRSFSAVALSGLP
jgi:hypothetical protein